MKPAYKILSVAVLASFLLNSIFPDYAFSQDINKRHNLDKLAPSSRFEDLTGRIDLQDIARVEMQLEGLALRSKNADGTLNIDALIEAAKEANDSIFKPGFEFSKADQVHFFAGEAKELRAGWCIKVALKSADASSNTGVRTYYAVVPGKIDARGGFPVRGYTEKEWNELGVRGHLSDKQELPDRSLERPKDARAIYRYKANNESVIASFIRDRIAAGDFTEIEGRAENLGLNLNAAGKEGYKRPGFYWSQDIMNYITKVLHDIDLVTSMKGSRALGKKNIVFIKIPEGQDYPVIVENGISVPVKSRSSNAAIYIFFKEKDFKRLDMYFRAKFSSEGKTSGIEALLKGTGFYDAFAHEIGVIHGLPFDITSDGRIVNDIDRALKAFRGGENPDTVRGRFPSLEAMQPVDLDILRDDNGDGLAYERDYAAGIAETEAMGASIAVDDMIVALYGAVSQELEKEARAAASGNPSLASFHASIVYIFRSRIFTLTHTQWANGDDETWHSLPNNRSIAALSSWLGSTVAAQIFADYLTENDCRRKVEEMTGALHKASDLVQEKMDRLPNNDLEMEHFYQVIISILLRTDEEIREIVELDGYEAAAQSLPDTSSAQSIRAWFGSSTAVGYLLEALGIKEKRADKMTVDAPGMTFLRDGYYITIRQGMGGWGETGYQAFVARAGQVVVPQFVPFA